MAQSLRTLIRDENPDAQFLTPSILDQAIVGYGGRPGEPVVPIYCRTRIQHILEDIGSIDPEAVHSIVIGTSGRGPINMPIIAVPKPEWDDDSDY
jgi:hypothetical protein